MPDNPTPDLTSFKNQIKNDFVANGLSKKDIFLNICKKINPKQSQASIKREYQKEDKEGVYKKLYDLIEEIYETNVSSCIYCGRANGENWHQIFNYFCKFNGYRVVKKSQTVYEWFHLHRTNQPIDKINEDYHKLIKRLDKARRMYEDAIYIPGDKLFQFMSSNLRYGFVLETDKVEDKTLNDKKLKECVSFDSEREIRMEVLDLCYGEKRTLPLTNPIISTALDYKFSITFVEIYSNQLLLMTQFNDTYPTHLFLIEFDLKEDKCKIVNCHNTNTEFEYIYVDQIDKERFLICGEEDFGHIGYVKNERIYKEKCPTDIYPSYCVNTRQLIGNTLQSLTVRQNGNKIKATYLEWKLKGSGGVEFNFKVDEDLEFSEHFTQRCQYVWHKKICYALSYRTNLLLFNANTRKCSKLNLELKGSICSMTLSDGMLLVNTNLREYYRLALRKPDKLLNLTWFRAQALNKHNNKNSYNHMKKMFLKSDTKMEPFYFNAQK